MHNRFSFLMVTVNLISSYHDVNHHLSGHLSEISGRTLMVLWLLPFRFRKLKERKKPLAAGILGSESPISWANSSPGRSMRRVILLSTKSVKTCGCSCFSRSTKKSGLKMTGWLTFGISWVMNTLHFVPLIKREISSLGKWAIIKFISKIERFKLHRS